MGFVFVCLHKKVYHRNIVKVLSGNECLNSLDCTCINLSGIINFYRKILRYFSSVDFFCSVHIPIMF